MRPERGRFNPETHRPFASLRDELIRTQRERLTQNPEQLLQSERTEALNQLAHREQAIHDHDVLSLLADYGIETDRIREEGSDHFVLNCPESDLPSLPHGYGYKGGAARSLLKLALGIAPFLQPRDLDVIRMAELAPNAEHDRQVAEKYMPEDLEHSDYGVEVVTSITEYFQNRGDLTINEVLVADGMIHCSRQALLDTVRGILRPTENALQSFATYSTELAPSVLTKIIRFWARALYKDGFPATIALPEGTSIESATIPTFFLALQIDRAFDEGKEIAEILVRKLQQHRQLPAHLTSAEEAAQWIMREMDSLQNSYRSPEQRLLEALKALAGNPAEQRRTLQDAQSDWSVSVVDEVHSPQLAMTVLEEICRQQQAQKDEYRISEGKRPIRPFHFRHAPTEQFEQETDLYENIH